MLREPFLFIRRSLGLVWRLVQLPHSFPVRLLGVLPSRKGTRKERGSTPDTPGHVETEQVMCTLQAMATERSEFCEFTDENHVF